MKKALPITPQEIMYKLYDKLDEAQDFLDEMEKTKKDTRLFRHRTSAFLTAADSVRMMIEKHAKRYAKQVNDLSSYNSWYEAEMNAFRAPGDKRPEGTDKTWMYLHVARIDTVHIEKTNLNQLTKMHMVLGIHGTGSLRAELHLSDGATAVTTPEPPRPPEPNTSYVEKDLWAFTAIQVFSKKDGEEDVIIKEVSAPPDDVVSVCKAHIAKLESLIEGCENMLMLLKSP